MDLECLPIINLYGVVRNGPSVASFRAIICLNRHERLQMGHSPGFLMSVRSRRPDRKMVRIVMMTPIGIPGPGGRTTQ